MKFFCYILYSKSINQYYIEYTSDIEERIKLHNTGHFGRKSYTSKVSDWNLFFISSLRNNRAINFHRIKDKKDEEQKIYRKSEELSRND